MKWYYIVLTVYAVLVVLNYFLFYYISKVFVNEKNSIFKPGIEPYKVNELRIIVMALFFPITWVKQLISNFVDKSSE